MNNFNSVFIPKPIKVESFDKRQERLITRWPLQQVCARIERLPLWEEPKDVESEY